jgi:hypothetical protein
VRRYPEIALLAAAGRGHINGEPNAGSLGGFIAAEVEMLCPRKVALCHHDNWIPPRTFPTDLEPIEHELARRATGVEFIEMPYLAACRIFGAASPVECLPSRETAFYPTREAARYLV